MNSETFLKHEISRRTFLERTAAGMVAGIGSAPATSAASASKGQRVRLGIVGVRRRGLELATALARLPGADVVALCDVDGSVRRAAAHSLSEVQSRAPRLISQAARLFEDDSIDAVVIATPDHTHASLAIAACQAGKDIYLEAPVTHLREEADLLQRAARGRIVQCGLQQRSGAHFRSAIECIRSGRLGHVGYVRAWAVHRRRMPTSLAGTAAAATVTAASDVDYQAWLGPAPSVAFDPARFHHHWRWFWDYGSGELGNLGVHLLDVARWGTGVELPQRVSAHGRTLEPRSALETPDTLTVHYEYPEVTIAWEHRLWSEYGVEGRSAGVAFYGTEGTLVIDRGGWKVYGSKESASASASPLLEPHLEDFLDAVRTRRPPAADLAVGCTSSTLCHLGNEAYRQGREWRA